MERLSERFKRDFPTIEERKMIHIDFGTERIAHTDTLAGYKMTAKNAVDVVLITENTLCTSRYAPYESWEALIGAAQQNFDVFIKIAGRRHVARIGTRFVNRFDFPNSMIQGKELSDFLRIGISIPEEITNTIGPYSLAVNTIENSTGAKILIQSAVIQPPALLDHTSITLDIDAFWDTEIPQRIEEMWNKTAILRDAKNSVFENSITDKLRELFQ
jgi:uncharacterized protein (TIGR04255 family)